MAPQSNQDQLAAAWRALAGREDDRGWRVIEVFRGQNAIMQAGRYSPGKEESLLIGTRGLRIGSDADLPRGQGFNVIYVDTVDSTDGWTWLALSRSGGGQLALFTMMAADLLSLFSQISSQEGGRIHVAMLSRIRAWQDFMKRDRPGVLSAEAEVGLFGELLVLKDIVSSGMAAADAVSCWAGPDDGLHDYLIGAGAIEVKSTVSPVGFVAEIGSLEQLDDSLRQPLYVAAVRLLLSENGQTLPEICDELESILTTGLGSAAALKGKLLSAGYADAMAGQYTRRFVLSHLGYRLIQDGSPRLIRSNVPVAVQRVKYALDLESIPEVATGFMGIVERFGGNATWN